MVNAAASIADTPDAAAQAWARSLTVRTLARAAVSGSGLTYRRIWPAAPSPVPAALADALAPEFEDWLDSTLDLRDGLSVVEVFTDLTAQRP